RGEVHAIRQRASHFVEHTHDDRTIALQVLDDLHPVQQLRASSLQLFDFLDTPIQQADFLAQEVIASILLIDLAVQVAVAEKDQQTGKQYDKHQNADELFLALFPELLAPGQQVNASHQSKLLIARPQAIISAGASLLSATAFTLFDRVMFAKGLATRVVVPSFCWIS